MNDRYQSQAVMSQREVIPHERASQHSGLGAACGGYLTSPSAWHTTDQGAGALMINLYCPCPNFITHEQTLLPANNKQRSEGGVKYTKTRLQKAANGDYAPTTTIAQANEAKEWIKQAEEQGKLSYKVRPVYLRQSADGVVKAHVGPEKAWP